MYDFGIIGAMEPELVTLISALSEHKTEHIGGIDFHLGKIAGRSVVIAKCGVGKVFSAMCAEAMVIAYKPKLIINTGIAGGLRSTMRPLDVVVASSLVQHDMDTSAIGDPVGLVSGINLIYFECDARAVQLALDTADSLGLNVRAGVMATGDKFVSSSGDKARIVSQFSADATEMEGCAAAQVAFVNNIPFLAIRAISDGADEVSAMSYAEFLPQAAENSARLTLEIIKRY